MSNPQRTLSKLQIALDLAALSPMVVEEWTAPATASTNALKTSVASSTSAKVYTGAALNGAKGSGVMSPPRNVTVTTGGTVASNISNTNVTFKGVDVNGDAISEAVAITATGGAATFSGVKAFAQVTEIDVPAQAGTSATLVFGFGPVIGLSKPIQTRAGAAAVIKEFYDANPVTNGTYTVKATGLPNGTYSPNTAPNASHNYALYYERTP